MIAVAICSIFIPTWIYPPLHKILRNKTVYVICFATALLILGFALSYSAEHPNNHNKSDALLGFGPLSFLILYKLFDSYIRNKLGRPIYFSQRFTNDIETKEQTTLEFFLQTILGLVPLLWIGIVILCFGSK